MSDCLCNHCAGLCCRYFALPLDNPETARDYDNIRWYLCHENVVVFVEKKQWYIGLMNRCKHLQADNRCGIYATRPKICRSYSTENCDYHGGDYNFELLFTSAEQLQQYAIETLKELREKKRKRRRQEKSDKPSPRMGGLRSSLGGTAKPKPSRRSLRLLSGAGSAVANGNENGRGISLPVVGGR